MSEKSNSGFVSKNESRVSNLDTLVLATKTGLYWKLASHVWSDLLSCFIIFDQIVIDVKQKFNMFNNCSF